MVLQHRGRYAFDRQPQLHLGFQALHAFRAKHNRLPMPHDDADAKEVVTLAEEINSKWFGPSFAVTYDDIGAGAYDNTPEP